MNHSNFYRQLEDRFRGDRSIIKGKLWVYLDFILPLKTLQGSFKALDLGCGRGEWLELLQDQGIEAFGIDLDAGMLTACRERGLQAEEGDAIAALQALQSSSISLVTAFHVAEHLPFDDLLSLVTEAHRVLTPGGLLILETPNPENLVVATHNFYFDPSHQRPLPPALLDFTTEYAGFERSRILRLQENEALSRSDVPGFWDVLNGASPDYSVIAQKAGPAFLLKSIDGPFSADQGLKPETIASRYDHQISHRLAHIEQELAKAEAPIIKLESILEQSTLSLKDRIELEKRLAIAESHLLESKANASALLERIERSEQEARHYQKEMALLEMKAIESREALETHQNRIKELTLQCESTQNQAIEWHDQIHRIKGSLSWRMTKPLRGLRTVILWTAGLLKGILEGVLLLALAILLVPLSPILIIAVPWILRKPVLRNKIGQRVKHFPPLRRLLKLATRTISPSSVASAAGHEASANSSKNGQKPIQEPNKGPQLEKKSPALGKLSGQIHRRLQQSN